MLSSKLCQPPGTPDLSDLCHKTREIFNGLAQKLSSRKPCTREHGQRNYPSGGREHHALRLQFLVEDTARKIELEDDIRRIMYEVEMAKMAGHSCGGVKEKIKPKKKKKKNKLEKTASKYDWAYTERNFADEISSPSNQSLKTVTDYYVLPGTRSKTVIKQLDKHSVISCDEDFIEYPDTSKNLVGKFRAVSSNVMANAKIQDLITKYQNWERKRRVKYMSDLMTVKKRKPQLFDRIMTGYKPHVEDRSDLKSLFDKIKPKKMRISKDWLQTCKECYDAIVSPGKKYHFSNTYRQDKVLKEYTPCEHKKMSVKKRREKARKLLASLNKAYYGAGPTLWKCNRVDDTWVTVGEISDKCLQEPCICPPKEIEEFPFTKKAFNYPTFLDISNRERDTLQCSWSRRGISKETLAMLWFQKLFKTDPNRLQRLMPSQTIDDMFNNDMNLSYMDQLAEIFGMVVRNLQYPHTCTRLICDIAYIHSCLDLKNKYFRTLKETLLATIKENFHPKPVENEKEAWKKFIDIVFDLVNYCFLWNKWPQTEVCGTKDIKLSEDADALRYADICCDEERICEEEEGVEEEEILTRFSRESPFSCWCEGDEAEQEIPLMNEISCNDFYLFELSSDSGIEGAPEGEREFSSEEFLQELDDVEQLVTEYQLDQSSIEELE